MNNRIGSASRRPASDDRATRNTGSISRRPGGAGGDAPAAKRIGNSYAGPYDHPHDATLVRDLALCRNLQVIPWLAVFAERDPSIAPRAKARIAKLPAG